MEPRACDGLSSARADGVMPFVGHVDPPHGQGDIQLDLGGRCSVALAPELFGGHNNVPREGTEIIRVERRRPARWRSGFFAPDWPHGASRQFPTLPELLRTSRRGSGGHDDAQSGYDCGTLIHQHLLRKHSGTRHCARSGSSSSVIVGSSAPSPPDQCPDPLVKIIESGLGQDLGERYTTGKA